jgi:hypothetical protein
MVSLFALCVCVLGGVWLYRGTANPSFPTAQPATANQEDITLPSAPPTEVKDLLVENHLATEAPTLEIEPTSFVDINFDWSKCNTKYSTRIHGGVKSSLMKPPHLLAIMY